MQWKINQTNAMHKWDEERCSLSWLIEIMKKSVSWWFGENYLIKRRKKFLNSNEHGHVQCPERVKAGTLVGEWLRAYSWVTHEDKKGFESYTNLETLCRALNLLLCVVESCWAVLANDLYDLMCFCVFSHSCSADNRMFREQETEELDRGHCNNCGSLPEKWWGYSGIIDNEKVWYLVEAGSKLQIQWVEFADMWKVQIERGKNGKMFQGL